VPLSELAANDYNLNIPRYIDSSEPEDLQDLSAHLQGGIPNRDIDALEHYWQAFPSLRATLFASARNGYSTALVKASNVKSTILNHSEFKTFASESLVPFTQWCKRAALDEIQLSEKPKNIIHRISEDLLISYSHNALMSKYDVYQILMDYWADTMQDDVYVLVQDGWQAGSGLREIVAKKGEKLKETPDLIINKKKYKAELIPPVLIQATYFSDEQQQLESLQARIDTITQELESCIEEHTGDEGLLSEALNDKDKVTKASIAARLKLAKDAEEKNLLKTVKQLFEQEAQAKKELKAAQDLLDLAVFKKYSALSESEIKSLLVNGKWLETLKANIIADIERVTQQMANRVKELEERYAEPLPALTESVEVLSDKVANHLKAMGLEWA